MSVLTFTAPPQFFGGDFFSPPFHHHNTATTTTTPTAGCKKARRSFVLGTRSARDHTVTETEDAFQLFVDLPGVKAADISLQIDEGVLKISGSRKFGGGQQQSSAFVKSFSTDEADVDTSKITANLADGVLAVTFPKRAKPAVVVKTITVTENPHEDWVTVDSKMDITDKGNTAKKD
jgi:HSP20 family protein